VCVYAYQLRGQVLTLWVYDPNSPLSNDVTMQLDISRTDQSRFEVRHNVNIGHSPICFFTQSYEQRTPIQGRVVEQGIGRLEQSPVPAHSPSLPP
jgi:hypothetical protein